MISTPEGVTVALPVSEHWPVVADCCTKSFTVVSASKTQGTFPLTAYCAVPEFPQPLTQIPIAVLVSLAPVIVKHGTPAAEDHFTNLFTTVPAAQLAPS